MMGQSSKSHVNSPNKRHSKDKKHKNKKSRRHGSEKDKFADCDVATLHDSGIVQVVRLVNNSNTRSGSSPESGEIGMERAKDSPERMTCRTASDNTPSLSCSPSEYQHSIKRQKVVDKKYEEEMITRHSGSRHYSRTPEYKAGHRHSSRPSLCRSYDKSPSGHNSKQDRPRSREKSSEKQRRHLKDHKANCGNNSSKSDRKKDKEKEDKEYEKKIMAKMEEIEVDEEAIIQERRLRRQEILAKFQEKSKNGNSLHGSELSLDENDEASHLKAEIDADDLSDDDIQLDEQNEEDLFRVADSGVQKNVPFAVGGNTAMKSDSANKDQESHEEGVEFDMFADVTVEETIEEVKHNKLMLKKGLLDQFDDSEGYYNFQVGELMNNRYEVFATHGKGVFSTVLRARDIKPVDENGVDLKIIDDVYPEVAIKVIRSNDIMSKAGQTEAAILRKLAESDPQNKYHIIRMLSTFSYRNHLCLVFEPLHSNLRQLTKKYGQGIGLRLEAVRSMAAQMLMALHLMKHCHVLHADIKPDNILINKGHNVIKICDFGSAMFTGKNDLTPYLVSRFYRAPEVILGLPYDHPMDMWSIGCVIFELFTGQILFTGRSNNEMLKQMMDLKGPFPKKMLKKGQFVSQHFDDDFSFCHMDMDPLTKRPVKHVIEHICVKRDFVARLSSQESGPHLSNLIDLLDKMMQLDPDKRINAKDALRHPFIQEGRRS